MSKNRLDLTDEEIHTLLALLNVMGFREKREVPKPYRDSRTEMNVVVGRIMKKLRKAERIG
jgi:hypothetical protein